jgi:Vitamin K-dependent gamma-carboxylase.
MLINNYLKKQTSAAPLAVFRLFFGLLIFLSIVRFWANGWIEKLYLDPTFHFSYLGFSFVKPIGNYTYLLFIICGISAFFVAIGFKYRLSLLSLFISFLYIELMDKTTYLNHYYFISILCFLLLFLPANAYFSVDAFKKNIQFNKVPKWTVDSFKITTIYCIFLRWLGKIKFRLVV